MSRLLMFLSLLILSSCEKVDLSGLLEEQSTSVESYELYILSNDTADFYASYLIQTGVYISNIPKLDNYRIPNKSEVPIIVSLNITSKERLLCLDDTIYKSFKPDGTGIVSKCGASTKYSILFIRSERTSEQITFSTDINITR